MGSFEGHAVPGTFFFCFGFWFVLSALRKKISWQPTNASSSCGTATVTSASAQSGEGCCSKFRKAPVEAYMKVICCFIGILIEGPAGIFFKDMARYQHTTMYSVFGLNGVIDLLVYYKVAPEQITHRLANLSFALSFVVEGVLFNFHLHGRGALDVRLHMLLVYVCFICAASCFIEVRHPGSTFGRLLRGYFIMVHGSWFWQVGAILYPLFGSKWDLEEPKNVMVAALIFSWHLVLTLVLVVCMAIIMNGCCCGRKVTASVDDKSREIYSSVPQIYKDDDADRVEKQLLLSEEDEEIEL